MINDLLTNELKRVICFIIFEYSNSSFGERNAQMIRFAVDNFYFVRCFEMPLLISSCWNLDLVIFSNVHSIDFRHKFYLFLRIIVQSYWRTEGIHMVIWKRFLGNCRSSQFWHSGIRPEDNRRRRSSSIDISSYQLNSSLIILLTAFIIDGNPTSNISLVFFLVNSYRVISLPAETSCSISNFDLGL